MAGFRVTLNDKQLVSVSNEGLNILAVQVCGDVTGKELSTIDVYGGHYGDGDKDKHLIWISDYEITSDNEVEISFCEDIETSHPGKTIKELHPETQQIKKPQQQMGELLEDLAKQPQLREKFVFELDAPHGKTIRSCTRVDEYIFSFIAMWKWTKPDEARISLTSNSLQGIEAKENGRNHARFSLQFEQGVNFRVRT